MLRWRPCLRSIVIAALFAAFAAPSAWAAAPVPWATVSRECYGPEAFYVSGPAATTYSGVLARATTPVTAGGGFSFDTEWPYGPGDVFWQSSGALEAGHSATLYFSCMTPATATVEFFAEPEPPTEFSGATTYVGQSTVSFRSPSAAQYVANAQVSGGTIALEGAANSPVVLAGSQAGIDLGTIPAGSHTLTIYGRPGPQAVWSIEVHALPVVLSALAFARPIVRAGELNTLSYTTSGETTVSANITTSSGEVVRQLANQLIVGVGTHTLTWDGATQDGLLLPDGYYSANLSAVDPSGTTGTFTASVLLNSHRPVIHLLSNKHLGRHQSVVARVTDFAMRSAALTVGRRHVSLNGRSGTLSLHPPTRSGWGAGRHRFVIRAQDVAGESSTYTGVFTVR
jgi:hypothetical protein